MSEQIIEQPDGKYAIWSTIVDDFIYTDLTPKQIIKIQRKIIEKDIEKKLMDIITKLKKGEKPYHQFTMTYEEAIEKRNEVHGLNRSESA